MNVGKLYTCERCGNIVQVVHASGVPVMCCGQKMVEMEPKTEEKVVCDLKPVDPKAKENYIVCKCNQVSYFDILDAMQTHSSIDNLLDVFEDVKNTTHCSTGCGGCFEKVITIISESMTR